MKLYVYDHCPYCVKARMIFGYKNLDFELKYLLNDDEKTPTEMIGQKMLPILKKEDGSFMPESLDIINYVDQNFGEKTFINNDLNDDPKLAQWLNESRDYLYPIAMPRWIKLDLEEFKTQGALDYFTRKKEDYIGSFDEHLSNTEVLVNKADEHLKVLDGLLVEDQRFFLKDPSLNDFHLYATLRSLTVSKDITFPRKVLDYMEEHEELSKVPLYLDIAI